MLLAPAPHDTVCGSSSRGFLVLWSARRGFLIVLLFLQFGDYLLQDNLRLLLHSNFLKDVRKNIQLLQKFLHIYLHILIQ